MANFNMTLLGEFDTILYDETPCTKEEYLRGTPKSILLRLASFMIGMDPNASRYYDWKAFLNMWFRDENIEFKKKIWERCIQLEIEHNTEISLLSPLASLRFFEFAFSFKTEEPLQSEIESEINLFKAYLLLLTNETNKETKSKNYLNELKGPYRIAATLFNQVYPVSDFTNYQLGDLFITQIIKAYYLFDFLTSKTECKALTEKFYELFGIKEWREYFQALIPIIEAHSKHPTEGWTELTVEKNERFEKNCFFLEALSLKHFDTELDTDFKLLRGNPLHKVEEGKYAIISPLFVLEKIYKGLYFKLKETYDTLKDDIRPSKNFRSYYTSKFSENYLLYVILNYIYGEKTYKQYSGIELEQMNISGAPDYYIRNGNKLFLFENKDVFINADVKQSFDFKKVEEELVRKFYFDKKADKISAKAVIQLTSNVELALTQKNSFDQNYKGKSLNIYPILVLHDPSFNTPGLNYILNQWFSDELQKVELKGINVSKVKPLTIINIDTLILYADFLKVKRKSLDELINGYIKFGVFDHKKRYKNFEEAKVAVGKSLLAFSFFIDEFTQVGFNDAPKNYRDIIMKGIFPK